MGGCFRWVMLVFLYIYIYIKKYLNKLKSTIKMSFIRTCVFFVLRYTNGCKRYFMNELKMLFLEKDYTAFKVKLSCPWDVSVQQHIQRIFIVEGSSSGYSFIYHHIPGTNI